MIYRVNEIFHSVQGEGYWSGAPCAFIRLQGCPVHCEWCDSGPLAPTIGNGQTTNTWGAGGVAMPVEEIVRQVGDAWHIVITGGEPLIWDLDVLLHHFEERYTQIETSGYGGFKGERRPSWTTVSPKYPINFEVAENIHPQELKFVVDDHLTPETIMKLEVRYPRAIVYLMPEGCPPRTKHIETALDWSQRFGWRVTDRLQYRFGIR